MDYPKDPIYKEAIAGLKRNQQWKVICSEIGSNINRNTFKFIERFKANHKYLINVKQVLKKKFLSNGLFKKYKIRIYAKRFT